MASNIRIVFVCLVAALARAAFRSGAWLSTTAQDSGYIKRERAKMSKHLGCLHNLKWTIGQTIDRIDTSSICSTRRRRAGLVFVPKYNGRLK